MKDIPGALLVASLPYWPMVRLTAAQARTLDPGVVYKVTRRQPSYGCVFRWYAPAKEILESPRATVTMARAALRVLRKWQRGIEGVDLSRNGRKAVQEFVLFSITQVPP